MVDVSSIFFIRTVEKDLAGTIGGILDVGTSLSNHFQIFISV